MVSFLKGVHASLADPAAILVVSAHWEEDVPTVTSGARPKLVYDYYGFPPESYEIEYPAPGKPELAGRVARVLASAGIECREDDARGFDHGLFVPLKLMYPDAGIPCVQLSLARGLDPRMHLNVGAALRELVEDGVLVLGSGFSFHNLRELLGARGGADERNDAFQDWLVETCTGGLDDEERDRRLVDWKDAPNARYCHPREEHLIPLHVCAGMARGPATVLFDDLVMGKRALGLAW